MLTRTGILSPRPAGYPRRSRGWPLPDLAERSPFIAGQRVRPRRQHAARRLVAIFRLVRLLLLLAAGLTGVAFGARWLLTSPRFAVGAVEVRGAHRLSEAQILSAAGIPPGVNLFRLDAEEEVARLERLSTVKRAEVIRSLPNRVTLVVEERLPFTLAQAGRLYWLDEEGVSLGPEPRAVAPRLPVITGVKPEGLLAGGFADDVRAGIFLIRALLRMGSALTREVSEIHMGGPDGPVLYTVDGVEIRLGAADWEARLARLDGVLPQIKSEREPVQYVDLRFKGQVVFKPLAR